MRWIVSSAQRLGKPLAGLWGRSEPLRGNVLRLLYPARCALCDTDLVGGLNGPQICVFCQKAIVPSNWVACERCGAPLPGENTAIQGVCRHCRGLQFDFDTVIALSTYRGRLQKAILKMKWQDGEPITEAMADLMINRRGSCIQELQPKVVVPIPIHWRRRWVRKTNSPDILAARIASFLQVPLRAGLLRLTRNIVPQKGLKIQERRKNLAGAFRVAKGYDIKDARVLLVDDVLTTGATCDMAAKVLKKAGAASVAVVVLARTLAETDG